MQYHFVEPLVVGKVESEKFAEIFVVTCVLLFKYTKGPVKCLDHKDKSIQVRLYFSSDSIKN